MGKIQRTIVARKARTSMPWFAPDSQRNKVGAKNRKLVARSAFWIWKLEQRLQIFLSTTTKRSLWRDIHDPDKRRCFGRVKSRLHVRQSSSTRFGRKKGLTQHIGKSKGGNNTKIHAAVDQYCRPIRLILSAGNINDIKIAPCLLENISLCGTTVMADKAYCSRKFLSLIERKGGKPCIPCKKTYKRQWNIDKEQYKKRNVVERFFQRLKDNRRLAMRFDKRSDRFSSFVLFASILLWLK